MVETVALDDGTTIDLRQFKFVIGTPGDDNLAGNDNPMLPDDTIISDAGNDIVSGGKGDDYILDYGGDDRFDGGEGNDRIDDYGGDDLYIYSNGPAQGRDTISDSSGIDTVALGNEYRLSNIQLVRVGNNNLAVVNAGREIVLIEGQFSGGSIEYLRFADGSAIDLLTYSHTLTGTEASDFLVGVSIGGGDDIINGLAGYDTIYGGDGNDTISGGKDDDTISGDNGDDMLRGDEGNDIVQGGAGNDTLIYSAGYDVFAGGTGDDTIQIENPSLTAADLTFGIGTNWYHILDVAFRGVVAFSSLSQFDPNQRVETLRFRDGSTFDLTRLQNAVDGTFDNDVLTGSAANDVIDARSGNDTLAGGLGDDYLTGGSGFDAAVFSTALSQSTITQTSAMSLTVAGPEGHDTLTGIEMLQFADGRVESADASPLVDDIYYARRYADVFHAGVDSDAHFAASGWREGRDPNAFFSTSRYLGANPDIKAAGINPLAHYELYGWREGRDPSAGFDTRLYLTHNPDVAAAGINPLTHYLEAGRFEGRVAYAAIGDSIRPNGFDAEFYLLSNPDVAAAGVDPYEHYLSYGWREGRNPNAWFDDAGYLKAYPDVAAANINPLDHYHLAGWREGRDPSANFDTSDYLSTYRDVAAAGIDPLLHYLVSGAYESRTTFADGIFA